MSRVYATVEEILFDVAKASIHPEVSTMKSRYL